MKNIKPYENYKFSSIDWLGDIPEHWETRKIKSLFNNPDSLFIDGDWIESKHINGNDVKYITTGNIGNGKYKEQGSGFITFETFKELNCTEVFENDILISRLNLPIGRCCLSPKFNTPLIVSVDVVICRPDKNYHRKYLTYLMNSRRYQESASLEARGATMKRVSRTILGNFYLTIPSISEQQTIAKFLDYKIGKIDRFIHKKKQLIKLLNEQKAAIINQAVTKGINENVKMKPSGIDWLGDIPEHWEVKKLKYVADFQSGEMITSESIEVSGSYQVFGGGGFRGYTENYTNDGSHILIGRQGALCGNIKYANGKFWASEHAIVTYPKIEFANFYLGEVLTVAKLGRLSQTAAQPGISIGQIKKLKVPFPKVEEQLEIVKFIETETATINQTISTIEKEIALVQEYRTTLIAEAVTGKIDVRDYKIPDIEADEEITEEFETDEILEEIEESEE